MRTTNLVVKVASRCNLNCTYCYMYNMGDDSYKLQPKFMSEEIIEAMFLRVKNHCIENELKNFLIIFHGGEPMLTGIAFYRKFIEIEKRIIPDSIRIDYSMQTNGVLVNEKAAEILKDLDIQLGVSLDGTPSSNNKNRIYHNGKGSYEAILKGFNVIKKVYGLKNANCLCVIDTNETPEDVYNHFKSIGVNDVHFLFQDFNYMQSKQEDVPKIGGWLIRMFNLWYNDTDVNKPQIRPLTDIMGLIFGLNKGSEVFGKGINDTLVIETDGSIETVDTLRICGNGFTKTSFNVKQDELSAIFEHSELARIYYNGHDNLCETCQKCPIESVCGGGYLGHRYADDATQFSNPTIYCKEIIELICHIQNEVLKELPVEALEKANVQPLDYLEIINFMTPNV